MPRSAEAKRAEKDDGTGSAASRWVQAVAWGVSRGVRASMVFVVLAGIGRLIGGPGTYGAGGYISVAAIYVCGGIIGGLVLAPLRSRLNAPTQAQAAKASAVGGLLVGLSWALTMRVATFGLGNWGAADLFVFFVYGAIVGPVTGFLIWNRLERRRERDNTRP